MGLIDYLGLLVFLEHEHGQKVESALHVCQVDNVDLFAHLVSHFFMVTYQPGVTLA